MATIRKRNGRFHVQIRRKGFPSITGTFSRLNVLFQAFIGNLDELSGIHPAVDLQGVSGEIAIDEGLFRIAVVDVEFVGTCLVVAGPVADKDIASTFDIVETRATGGDPNRSRSGCR